MKRSPLKRKTRIKATNSRRKRENFARSYGSAARVEWIKAMHCYACGAWGCVNAHIETGGMGYKADADTIVNLCGACHDESHRVGLAEFAEACDLTVQDFQDRADQIAAAWEAKR